MSDRLGLQSSKLLLTKLGKNLPDRFADSLFDRCIQIKKGITEQNGKRPTGFGLAGAHESNKKDRRAVAYHKPKVSPGLPRQ
jgi:hypothetical protein